MRHGRKVKKLGRTAAHRNAMLRNLVAALFNATPDDNGLRRIRTTVPKAKAARRLAERLITLGKRGTLHARRRALALLPNKRTVKTLFEDIAPLYNDRNGGYTRIVRLPVFRRGDGAELCFLELVTGPAAPKQKAEPVAPKVAPPAATEPQASAETEETPTEEPEPSGEGQQPEAEQQPAPESDQAATEEPTEKDTEDQQEPPN